MTHTEQACKLIGIDRQFDVLDVADFRYLEQRGYRFLIEFGYENAADVADYHRHCEREQKTRFLRRDQAQ